MLVLSGYCANRCQQLQRWQVPKKPFSGGTATPIASSPVPRAEAPLELLVAGMRQPQEATIRATNGFLKGDVGETIKPGVTSLPSLLEPNADGPVDFQDWMYSISPALEDISDNSAVWWNEWNETAANQAYGTCLKLDPVARLTYVPKGTDSLNVLERGSKPC